MASLKQQIVLSAIACLLLTLLFGVGLSIAVNRALEGLEGQSDLILPDGSGPAGSQ